MKKTSNTRSLNEQYFDKLADAIVELRGVVKGMEYEISMMSNQMDMLAILSNGISEILLKKKFITKKELTRTLVGLKVSLDDMRKIQYDEYVKFKTINSDVHGNA